MLDSLPVTPGIQDQVNGHGYDEGLIFGDLSSTDVV
jgi:hypothetical protein